MTSFFPVSSNSHHASNEAFYRLDSYCAFVPSSSDGNIVITLIPTILYSSWCGWWCGRGLSFLLGEDWIRQPQIRLRHKPLWLELEARCLCMMGEWQSWLENSRGNANGKEVPVLRTRFNQSSNQSIAHSKNWTKVTASPLFCLWAPQAQSDKSIKEETRFPVFAFSIRFKLAPPPNFSRLCGF